MGKNAWGLVDAFFDQYKLVDHHIKSYNDFVDHRIQDIIDITENIVLEQGEYRVETGKLEIRKPFIKEADGSKSVIYPTEARLRNLTYSAHMYLEMALIKEGEPEPDLEKVYIGELPVMLKSNICHLNGLNENELDERGEDPQDPGGYFIVNGSERAIVTMEEIAPNKIILERIGEREDRRARAIVTSIKSGFRARITLEYRKPRKKGVFLRISFPYVPGEIPLVVLLRALGLETDEELVTSVYRIKRAEDVIDRYLLPHMGVDPEHRADKATYLAEMTEMLLQVIFETREPHDKDHYANKRLRVSGDLMEDLFRVAFTSLTRDMTYQLERSLARGKEPSVKQAVRSDVLTENIKHAIATGNWVGGRAGVSQLLDRTSYMGTLSHLKRVVSPLSRSQPHFEARDLHPTQFGKICPNETPEGPNCGLVKNLALLAKISEGSDPAEIENVIKKMGVLSSK
jgi:DNA-directed RNA polymerase subunit B"